MDNALIASGFAAILVGAFVAIATTSTLGWIAAGVTFVGTFVYQLARP